MGYCAYRTGLTSPTFPRAVMAKRRASLLPSSSLASPKQEKKIKVCHKEEKDKSIVLRNKNLNNEQMGNCDSLLCCRHVMAIPLSLPVSVVVSQDDEDVPQAGTGEESRESKKDQKIKLLKEGLILYYHITDKEETSSLVEVCSLREVQEGSSFGLAMTWVTECHFTDAELQWILDNPHCNTDYAKAPIKWSLGQYTSDQGGMYEVISEKMSRLGKEWNNEKLSSSKVIRATWSDRWL